jgi:hypothetical protein
LTRTRTHTGRQRRTQRGRARSIPTRTRARTRQARRTHRRRIPTNRQRRRKKQRRDAQRRRLRLRRHRTIVILTTHFRIARNWVRALDCLLLHRIRCDKRWFRVRKHRRAGLRADDVAEGLACDGGDVDAGGGGDDAEAADLGEV